MALRETYSLAHTAQCKLNMAADRPDRDLRFLVGHAMHLDSLMLRIVEIEESIEQPQHASGIKFKGVGGTPGHSTPNKPQRTRRSPSPSAADLDDESDEDEPDVDEDNDDEADLGLTRFLSASTQPPRKIEEIPQLIPSDDSSSDEEEDYSELLRGIISKNEVGDEHLAHLYNDVKNCPCHGGDAQAIERMWEIPSEKGGGRRAAVEVVG
jgi:hypothetical protein